MDEHNNPLLSLGGDGPEVHVDVFGTGFLVSERGQILTNHHVAEPWWQSDELKEMLDQGLQPDVLEMTAYFPGVTRGIAIAIEKISPAADVAVLKGNVAGLGIRQIALAEGDRGAVSGVPVVLLGYPTGVGAILARAGAETLRSIASVTLEPLNPFCSGISPITYCGLLNAYSTQYVDLRSQATQLATDSFNKGARHEFFD